MTILYCNPLSTYVSQTAFVAVFTNSKTSLPILVVEVVGVSGTTGVGFRHPMK